MKMNKRMRACMLLASFFLFFTSCEEVSHYEIVDVFYSYDRAEIIDFDPYVERVSYPNQTSVDIQYSVYLPTEMSAFLGPPRQNFEDFERLARRNVRIPVFEDRDLVRPKYLEMPVEFNTPFFFKGEVLASTVEIPYRYRLEGEYVMHPWRLVVPYTLIVMDTSTDEEFVLSGFSEFDYVNLEVIRERLVPNN